MVLWKWFVVVVSWSPPGTVLCATQRGKGAQRFFLAPPGPASTGGSFFILLFLFYFLNRKIEIFLEIN